MDDPIDSVENDDLFGAVFAIRDILYHTDEGYDQDNEWDVGMLEDIASVLQRIGLVPMGLEVYE